MTPKHGMPELPGMWYDTTRNRYFRITQDCRPPPAVQEPKATQSPKQPTISRFLRQAETGQDGMNAQSLPATLLANAKPIPVKPEGRHVRGKMPINMADAMPLVTGSALGNMVVLCAYPMLTVEDSASVGYGLLDVDWNWPKGVLAVTTSTLSGNETEYELLFCALGQSRNTNGGSLIVYVDLEEYPYAIAIGEQNGFVVTGEASTYILPSLGFQGRPNTARFPHPDQSPGLSTIFTTRDDLFTGTRAGHVYRWDVRARRSRPICTLRPSGALCSVTDLKLGSDNITLYTSCMRNEQNNLAGWDLRMCDIRPDPVVVFAGHANSHKRMRFDLDETGSGGLLLAGGDDSHVRMWNSRSGGSATGWRKFSDELPMRVKLSGWGTDHADVPPGAWIITDKGAYVMVSGARS